MHITVLTKSVFSCLNGSEVLGEDSSQRPHCQVLSVFDAVLSWYVLLIFLLILLNVLS